MNRQINIARQCKIPNCTKYRVQRGVCISHGARPHFRSESILCSIPNCTKYRVQGGVCISHGARRQLCSEQNCNNPVKHFGKCSTHGPERRICSVDGCSRRAKKGKICTTHGAPRNMCIYTNCKKWAITGGMCTRHKKITLTAETTMSEEQEAAAAAALLLSISTVLPPATEMAPRDQYHDDQLTTTCFECNDADEMTNDVNLSEQETEASSSLLSISTVVATPTQMAPQDYLIDRLTTTCFECNDDDEKTNEVNLDDWVQNEAEPVPLPFPTAPPVVTVINDDGNNVPSIHTTTSDQSSEVCNNEYAVLATDGIIGVNNQHDFIPTQLRPAPPLPLLLASGKTVPGRCHSPFHQSAPDGFWNEVKQEITDCTTSLLELESPEPFLFLHIDELTKDINMDDTMERGGYIGFCIHTDMDVLLCGLNPNAAKIAFMKIAQHRNATDIIDNSETMIPLIAAKAKSDMGTFSIADDYTTRFGYSTNQLGPIRRLTYSPCYFQSCVARGGPAQQAFLQNPKLYGQENIITTRVGIRMKMVKEAEKVSNNFREWRNVPRQRITWNTQQRNTFVRCPFTLSTSLPLRSDKDQVTLATWESSLRGIEEHLMVSLFGALPNVIWASILARVLERTEIELGDFDVEAFKRWTKTNKKTEPTNLGFPAKGCVGRILPKGAAGVSPSKPMHDDNNGVISLGCWTSLTESNAPVDLIFLINGHEVSNRATRLRWLLFMGYLPHETRSSNTNSPATLPRLHHSSFVKPETEYLATHVLSNLPYTDIEGQNDWSIEFVNSTNGLRADRKIVPIPNKDKTTSIISSKRLRNKAC